MIDDNGEDCPVCPGCGERHPQTEAERYFFAECEKAGLPIDESVPGKTRMVVTIASVFLAPLHGSIEEDPGALRYYAAALRGLAALAETQAEEAIAEALADLDEITPERFR
jgi:hypothetical protein